MHLVNGPIDWRTIDLVVFDMDGTLYDQGRLRRQIAARLLSASVSSMSLETVMILRDFRRLREEPGAHEDVDFFRNQYAVTARRCRRTPEEVRQTVAEWMEKRPLPLLGPCRYPHVDRLFDALRAARKTVAILSDYPAREKMKALGLEADIIVSACDSDVQRMKPHPAGLKRILSQVGAEAERTLLIGDRVDRDAAVAHRAGVRPLIRSRSRYANIDTFLSYDDAVFSGLFTAQHRTAAEPAR